jgi:hypothetical protein
MPQRAVYKTTNAEYLDEAGCDPGRLEEALEALKIAPALELVTRQLEANEALPAGSADDFNQFAEAKGSDTFELIMRKGYQEALTLAISRELPIETFWVTAPGDDFELHIAEGRNAICVFFFVPGEESRDYGSRRAGSRSWVIRAGDRNDLHPDADRTSLDDGIVKIQVSGPPGSAG